MSSIDVGRRPMRLTAAQWDMVGASRRGLLHLGPPVSGRVAAGRSATILWCEMGLAGVPEPYARELVIDGMPFSPGVTPEARVRRETLPYFFGNGYRQGLKGRGMGCVCTNREHRLAHLLEPYCEGSCFSTRRKLEPWQVAVLKTLGTVAQRDVWTFICRHADDAGWFTCSATYIVRGLYYLHSLRTVKLAYAQLGRLGLVERGGESKVLGVPLRRVVHPRGIGGAVDVLADARVEASGLGTVFCAPRLGATARDVYGVAAIGVDNAGEAAAILGLDRRRAGTVAGRLRSAGLLRGRLTWTVTGEVDPLVQAAGESVAGQRRSLILGEVERGRERLEQHRRYGIAMLAA